MRSEVKFEINECKFVKSKYTILKCEVIVQEAKVELTDFEQEVNNKFSIVKKEVNDRFEVLENK